MKKKFILSMSIACLSLSLMAQEVENAITQETVTTTTSSNAVVETPTKKKAKLWIGPKFGLDISSTTLTSEAVENELKKNYQFGLLMQYGRILYIQPEIYYASYKSTLSSKETITNNYIKIPVQLGLKFLDLGLFSLHVTTGPTYTFKLDDADKLTSTKGFSWLVGAGVDVLGFITSDLRYTLRNNVSIADQISEFSSTSNTLNLTIGLKLR